MYVRMYICARVRIILPNRRYVIRIRSLQKCRDFRKTEEIGLILYLNREKRERELLRAFMYVRVNHDLPTRTVSLDESFQYRI